MAYKIKYEAGADIVSFFLAEGGKLAYAEEMGDIVVHVDDEGKPLYLEVLHASKMLPALVQAFVQKQAVTVKH